MCATNHKVIAEQGGQIAEQDGRISNMAKEMAEMKRLLAEAGITPAPEVEVLIEVEKSKSSKKRLPSGPPNDKRSHSVSTESGTSSGLSSEDDPMDDEDRVLKRPDFRKKGRNEIKK